MSPDNRAPYEGQALELARILAGPAPASAYARLTAEARQLQSPERFAADVRSILRGALPLTGIRVAHSYRLRSLVSAGAAQIVMCTAQARGNVGTPEGRVYVAASAVPEQAHVIVTAEGKHVTWTFALWLIPEEGEWRAQSASIDPDAVDGKSADYYRAAAREQLRRSHDFNAYLLYPLALRQAIKGPAFRLGIAPEIEKEMAALPSPHALTGKLPYIWNLGDQTYRITAIGPLVVGGNVDLRILQEVPGPASDEELDLRNRALGRAFAALDPDYAEAFEALLIQARAEGSTSGFGTVIERKGPDALLSGK